MPRQPAPTHPASGQTIYILVEERGTYDMWEHKIHGVTADLLRAQEWKASGTGYVGDFDNDVAGHRYYDEFTVDSFTDAIAAPPAWWKP